MFFWWDRFLQRPLIDDSPLRETICYEYANYVTSRLTAKCQRKCIVMENNCLCTAITRREYFTSRYIIRMQWECKWFANDWSIASMNSIPFACLGSSATSTMVSKGMFANLPVHSFARYRRQTTAIHYINNWMIQIFLRTHSVRYSWGTAGISNSTIGNSPLTAIHFLWQLWQSNVTSRLICIFITNSFS